MGAVLPRVVSANQAQEPPIHTPQPIFSPPLLAFGVMLIAFGVLLGPVFLVVGGVIFVSGIATWLIDDARAYANAPEPTDGAHHYPMRSTLEDRTVVRGRRAAPADRLPPNETGLEAQPSRFSAGMWAVILFVSSEAFFFGALFTTYFFLRARIPEWEPVFGEKPTWQVDPIFGIGLPTLNTIELLLSSVTMQIDVNAIKRGDRRSLRNWLIQTIILGVSQLR